MKIARHLKSKRVKGGALELESVEVQVQLTETKSVEDLTPKDVIYISVLTCNMIECVDQDILTKSESVGENIFCLLFINMTNNKNENKYKTVGTWGLNMILQTAY